MPSDRSCGDRRCRISKDKKCRSSCFWNGISLNLLTHGSRLEDETVLPIDCIAVEDEYGNTPVQRAELDWLLYNKPLEYAQLVLGGEIEHYLSLGCDHGRLEEQ